MSVRLSARNNLATARRIFMKFDIWVFFEKKNCWENSSFVKIWQEYRALYIKTNIHFWSYLAPFFLQWEMFQTQGVKKLKTHALISVTISENCAVYGIKRKNILKPGRPQMKIWRMCIACWIPKAKNTLSEYVILTALPLQQRLQERASLLCYTYVAYFVAYWRRVF